MATRVCRYCKGKSEMSEMTSIKEGKTNKFFHEKCLKEYQEEQIFKAEQKVKRESLFEKIAEIEESYSIKFEALQKRLNTVLLAVGINQDAKTVILQNEYKELSEQKDLELLEVLGGI